MKQIAKLLFHKNFNLNLLTFSKADRACIQYCNFIDNDMQLIQESAKLFKCGESHIDYFFQKVKKDIKYPDMLTSLVLIVTLSHGQADVEKGFNNNSLVVKDNLKIDSIVARLFINSYMIQKEIEPHQMPITHEICQCSMWQILPSSWRTKKDKAQKEIDSKKQEMIKSQSVKENFQWLQDLIR